MTKQKRLWGNCFIIAFLAFCKNPFSTRIHRIVDEYGKWHFFWRNKKGFFNFTPIHKIPQDSLERLWYAGRIRMIMGFVETEEQRRLRERIQELKLWLEA